MTPQCIQKSFLFHSLGKRDVVARFDGGRITSEPENGSGKAPG